jgi:hypothetical protein
MERIPGVELDKVWEDLPGRARAQVVQRLAQYDAALATCNFPMYGSLYYANDLLDALPSQMVRLDNSIHAGPNTQFAIGPTTNRAYFDDLRAEADPNLGPCRLFTILESQDLTEFLKGPILTNTFNLEQTGN